MRVFMSSKLSDNHSFMNDHVNPRLVKQEDRIRLGEVNLWGPGPVGQSLPPGNHEWNFEFQVPGDVIESIEGLPYSWLVYRLKAEAERSVFARNLVSRKHIRLIRTLDPTSLSLFQEVVSGTNLPALSFFANFEVCGPIVGQQGQVHTEFAYRSCCIGFANSMRLCSHPSPQRHQSGQSSLTAMGTGRVPHDSKYRYPCSKGRHRKAHHACR